MKIKMIATIAVVTALSGALAGCSSLSADSSAMLSKASTAIHGVAQRASSSQQASASSSTTSPGNVSVYFPRAGQDAEDTLISEINTAKKTLDVAIYEFTDTKIADAIASAKKRGATVRMIADKECSSQSYQKKALNIVKAAGIPIKVNSHTGIMHLKVSIIDDSVTTTGSFNYTKSAQSVNDENLVVLNSASLSQQYEAEFNCMWSDTQNYADWNG